MSLNTADRHDTDTDGEGRGAVMERAVPPAMLVVALAMGVAGYLHLGLLPELAAAVGLALFCVMLLCHVLLRAADAADRALEEEEERMAGEVASPIPVPVMPPAPAIPAAPAMPSPPPPPVAAAVDLPTYHRTPPPVPPPVAPPDEAPSVTAHNNPPVASATPPGWDFRPIEAQPPARRPTILGPQAAGPADLDDLPDRHLLPDRMRPAPAAPPASDRVEAILKRLAAQIRSAATTPRSTERAEPPLPTLPTFPAMLSDGQAAATPGPAAQDAAGVDQAVDALRSTVEAMRNALTPSGTGAATGPTLPVVAEARLAAVAEALAAERADVYLEPILQLARDQAHHFEVSVRLVDAAGADLDARATSARAGNAELLSLLDAVGLKHAAGFALKLERRGREGSVFSEVAGGSLADERFVSDASGRHAQGIADRLVLTFLQDEMRTLGPAQIAALGDLARLGFRFAIQGVTHLDMDFEALRGCGLQFVKLDAEVFLQGLQCGGAEVPASDICRFFDELGLEVIVSGIDSDVLRQRIEGCGVAYGQGLMFGAPRPIPVLAQPGGIAA